MPSGYILPTVESTTEAFQVLSSLKTVKTLKAMLLGSTVCGGYRDTDRTPTEVQIRQLEKLQMVLSEPSGCELVEQLSGIMEKYNETAAVAM